MTAWFWCWRCDTHTPFLLDDRSPVTCTGCGYTSPNKLSVFREAMDLIEVQ